MRLNSSVFLLFDTLDPLVYAIRYDQIHIFIDKKEFSFSKKVPIEKVVGL